MTVLFDGADFFLENIKLDQPLKKLRPVTNPPLFITLLTTEHHIPILS
jgi:hypothetical protein